MNLSAGLETLLRGGFMMYPLIISGLIALTIVIERFYMMKFRFTSESDMAKKVLASLRGAGGLKTAYESVRDPKTPVASVLEAGLREAQAPIDEIEIAMQNQAEMWIPVLEKRLDILDTIITAAPLMGLLGTITGMMASFQILSEKGVNEPNAITGGVAEALIATATGLVIALLCLMAYNYFNNRVKHIIYEMESTGAQLIEAKKILARTQL